MARTIVAMVVASVLAMSGCVQGEAKACVGDACASMDDTDVVLVRGVVLSEEIFPVPGALISVVDGPQAQTDAQGRFEVAVPPGSHVLNITAEGYEPADTKFDAVSGQAVELRLTLKGIPGQSPYSRTLLHTGMNACSFSAVYSAGPFPGNGVPCAFGQTDSRFAVEVDSTWAAGVHELEWKTAEDMIFASHVKNLRPRNNVVGCQTSGASHSWCPAMIWGPSPLRIFARPDDAAYAAQYAIDGKETWPGGENYTSTIFASYSGYLQRDINSTFYDQCVIINRQFNVPEKWGCPFGVGYSLGIRLNFYHTTFYLAAPENLEAYTALPDA